MKNNRSKIIIRTSILGIVANAFLSLFKVIVGILSNSIAITLDAVNNMTDAASSIISIIGAKLASKEPDKEHPFGHGRIEYIAALSIAVIILYAGLASLFESFKKIIEPVVPNYTGFTITVVFVATIVKIFLGLYVEKKGAEINSSSLINSGKDALMDAVISFSTLVAAIFYMTLKISLEAYLGFIISLFIIKAGIDMIRNTVSDLLGRKVNNEIANSLKETVTSFKEVYNAHDLMLSDYGPDTYLGSIHIEIDENMLAKDIDELTRNITHKVLKKHNVILTAIGIYSVNNADKEAIKIREDVHRVVSEFKSIIQLHGFYLNKQKKHIHFDVIMDLSEKNPQRIVSKIKTKLNKIYPNYNFYITVDLDLND